MADGDIDRHTDSSGRDSVAPRLSTPYHDFQAAPHTTAVSSTRGNDFASPALDLNDFENFLYKEENLRYGVNPDDRTEGRLQWSSTTGSGFSTSFPPRLVFIEDDETDDAFDTLGTSRTLQHLLEPGTSADVNSHNDGLFNCKTLTSDCESSIHQTSVSGQLAATHFDTPLKSRDVTNHSLTGNNSGVPDSSSAQECSKLTSQSPRHSQVSVQSSDSDLIMDGEDIDATETDLLVPAETDEAHERNPHANNWDRRWHCHRLGPKPPPDKMARNQLIAVSVLCFTFMCGEAIGGALSNSLALFTDVLHLGSDLISFLISLLALYLSRKPATTSMSFGYHRAEVLGALFSVFIIWLVSGLLCYMAVERIVHEHYKNVKPDEMLVTAVLGVVFNLVMGFVLHSEVCCKSRKSFGHNHSHSHGHSHSSHSANSNQVDSFHGNSTDSGFSYQPVTEERHDFHIDTELDDEERQIKHTQKNINVRAAFIHVIGDIIQSLGVLIASIIIKLKPEEKYRLADPICTFVFSLLVLITTITVLRDTLYVIMEGVPRDISYTVIKASLVKIPGVKMVHGLSIWCLTLEKNAIAVHLAIESDANHKLVLSKASEMLRHKYNFIHTTIQVEEYTADIMGNCIDCQALN